MFELTRKKSGKNFKRPARKRGKRVREDRGGTRWSASGEGNQKNRYETEIQDKKGRKKSAAPNRDNRRGRDGDLKEEKMLCQKREKTRDSEISGDRA